jgi:hypothetical protein
VLAGLVGRNDWIHLVLLKGCAMAAWGS